MDQHIISAWLLRSFARAVGRDHVLAVYDKLLDTYDDVSVDDFLAETDAHAPALEIELGRVEGRAAEAGRRIRKASKLLDGGLYTLVGPDEVVRTKGRDLSDRGVFHGMRLMATERQIPSPSPGDRMALARYAGLMYQRAPKVEAALEEFGRVYDATARLVLERMVPQLANGVIGSVSRDVSARRGRMLRSAANIGDQLARANWWVLRAVPTAPLILGDNPVVTTISLGHDDVWRPILSESSFVVAMPLGPTFAIVMAPRSIVPISGVETVDDAVPAINRLIWRSADRFVLGRDRNQLERALSGAGSFDRQAGVPVDYGSERIARSAMGETILMVARTMWRATFGSWQRWHGCRLIFGYRPWPAEGRELFYGPPDH